MIVLDDANINKTVESCVSGAFWAVGQNCLGVQRIFVVETVFDEFLEKFVERTKEYKVGDKKDEQTDMGPLIHEKEALRIEQIVNDAKQDGAKLLTGGKRDGAFYMPTVLTDVPLHSKVAQKKFSVLLLVYFQFVV